MTLVWQPGYAGLDDPDAAAYITNVEAADLAAGQSGGLEDEVKLAIHNFVKGCKNDGIWPAIKASCILAGAKTLAGALVPLVKQPADSAPARFGTEGGWSYNRETGLQGNGTDNYINSGRNNNADPQDNQHLSVFPTTVNTTTALRIYMGTGSFSTGSTYFGTTTTDAFSRNRSSTADQVLTRGPANSLIGVSRSSNNTYTYRQGGGNTPVTRVSETPDSGNVFIYQSNGRPSYSDARLAFYSIGESLNLAALDTRVSALITAIGAAIP